MSQLETFKTILELKRYSPNTCNVYINAVKTLIEYLNLEATKLKELYDKDILLSVINIVKIQEL